MSTTTKLKGHCVCGKIQVEARTDDLSVSACHCKMCRRWSGGPFMEIDCGQAVTFTGEEYLSVFDSSDWADRGFCSNCGSHLFYRLKETQQHMVPVGHDFEDGYDATFKKQVFIDEKPSFYAFENETHNMTGAELFALFGAED